MRKLPLSPEEMWRNKGLLAECFTTDDVKVGDFVLKSGKKSDIYIDAKAVLMTSSALVEATEMILTMISQWSHRIGAVAGFAEGTNALLGAVILGSTLLSPTSKSLRGLLLRNQAKEHGLETVIVGLPDPCEVVVLEDVTTTGQTVWQVADMLQKLKFTVRGAISVIDRCEGAHEFLARKGIKLRSLLTLSDLRFKFSEFPEPPCSQQTSSPATLNAGSPVV